MKYCLCSVIKLYTSLKIASIQLYCKLKILKRLLTGGMYVCNYKQSHPVA